MTEQWAAQKATGKQGRFGEIANDEPTGTDLHDYDFTDDALGEWHDSADGKIRVQYVRQGEGRYEYPYDWQDPHDVELLRVNLQVREDHPLAGRRLHPGGWAEIDLASTALTRVPAYLCETDPGRLREILSRRLSKISRILDTGDTQKAMWALEDLNYDDSWKADPEEDFHEFQIQQAAKEQQARKKVAAAAEAVFDAKTEAISGELKYRLAGTGITEVKYKSAFGYHVIDWVKRGDETISGRDVSALDDATIATIQKVASDVLPRGTKHPDPLTKQYVDEVMHQRPYRL